MKTYTIPELAPMIAQAHGSKHSEIPTFERRLRHLVANGVVEVVHREGTGPKARAHLGRQEACLASLVIFLGERLNFDLKLQKKIAKASREFLSRQKPGSYSGGALVAALNGVAAGEDWAMVVNLRSDNSARVHFLPLQQATLNADTEALLTAIGRELVGRLVIGISPLLQPFIQETIGEAE